MSALPHSGQARRSRLLVPLQIAWRDWLTEEAPIIGYMLKVLLACLLAMWLSLRFELDQPRTAMLTVAIVMQSRSGMVFAKSYYRLLGTLVGILVSFILVALFAQERVLFLLCMAIWIGICTAGSMIYRNHQSYAFVLAGYTLCIVGLPAAISPELIFNIGSTRISEILIGLLCATLVSDLIFPQRMWDVMLATVRRRFSDFSDLLRAAALHPEASPSSKSTLLRFVGDIFSLESFRASAVLENDKSRLYRLRLSQMNNEFMEASTSLHALEQLLRRRRHHGHPQVSAALLLLCQQLASAMTLDGRSARTEQEALLINGQLASFRAGFAQALVAACRQLPAELSENARLDFDTGAELLERLADELHVYTGTYASLAAPQGVSRSTIFADRPPRLEMHFDPLAVSLAGVRGALAMAVMSALWILTDWQSGVEAITIGVVTSTLFASGPSPSRTIRQFLGGAVIGTLLAYLCNFHWLTQAQGYWMLALAVSPGILLAAWLTTRPSTAVIGAGTFIIFLMHIGFNSSYSANPVIFINDTIADLLAILMSGVMYALIDLSNSQWSRQRTAWALRRLVVAACREPLALRRTRLETTARDLIQRAGSPQHTAEQQDSSVIDWLLSTLEIGHAVIALREHLQDIRDGALADPMRAALMAIAELYDSPSGPRRMAAISATDAAMTSLSGTEAISAMPQSTRHKLQTMLHFIHSALLDEESVLASSAPLAPGEA
jgi:uncharacterized membrane protein YccC